MYFSLKLGAHPPRWSQCFSSLFDVFRCGERSTASTRRDNAAWVLSSSQRSPSTSFTNSPEISRSTGHSSGFATARSSMAPAQLCGHAVGFMKLDAGKPWMELAKADGIWNVILFARENPSVTWECSVRLVSWGSATIVYTNLRISLVDEPFVPSDGQMNFWEGFPSVWVHNAVTFHIELNQIPIVFGAVLTALVEKWSQQSCS